MHKDNLLRYIAIVVVALVLIGFLVVIYFLNKPSARIVQGEADYDIASHQLFAEFEDNEEKANEKYLNKILAVHGPVREISEPDSLGFTVTLGTHGIFGISCEISDPEKSELINIGDSVIVKGLCTGMLMDVVLVKCIIENNQTRI